MIVVQILKKSNIQLYNGDLSSNDFCYFAIVIFINIGKFKKFNILSFHKFLFTIHKENFKIFRHILNGLGAF